MIKKTITIASMVILSAALMWAVWEGNAAAGSSEDFPSGLFASSDLFPKYTLIEITNLENNIISRAVIINNKGAQGVLVQLSPDLAKALALQEGNTARVRVSIPPLVAEEGADPVLLGKVEPKEPTQPEPAEPEPAPEEEPAAPIAEVTEPAQPEPVPEEEPPAPIAEVTEPTQPEPAEPEPAPEEEPAAPIAEVTEPAQPEPVPEEEPPAPIAEVTEPVQPEPAPEEPAAPIAEVTEPAQPEPAPEEPAAPIAEVTEPVQPEPAPEEPPAPIAEVTEPAQPEPAPEEPAAPIAEVTEPVNQAAASESSIAAEKPVLDAPPMQEPPQEGRDSSGEYTKQVSQVAEIAVPKTQQESNTLLSPVPEVSTPIEPEPAVAETPEETAEPAVIGASNSEKQQEEPTDESDIVAAAPNEEQTEESEELRDEPAIVIAQEMLEEKEPEDDTAEDDLITEQHVMLIPSDPRIPMTEHIPVPKEPEKPIIASAPVVTQPTNPVVTQAAEEPYTAQTLTKGAFYVQIGRFKDMLNVDSFVQRYGKQYPIAVEKSSTTNEVFYKVYIGPLQKDEQGAALETFQKLGFKDAFLKKAP